MSSISSSKENKNSFVIYNLWCVDVNWVWQAMKTERTKKMYTEKVRGKTAEYWIPWLEGKS